MSSIPNASVKSAFFDYIDEPSDFNVNDSSNPQCIINGPHASSPYDPNKGPPTMPSLSGVNPPSQADADATNAYLSSMMEWDARLQTPFKGYNQIDHTTYENLVTFIKSFQLKIAGAKTSAALQSMMDQVRTKCLNPTPPTPDQKQAQQILAQAQSLTNKYISLLQGLIGQLSKYSSRVAIDKQAIAHFLSEKSSATDPQGLANALDKSTAKLDQITAQKPHRATFIKALNQAMNNTNATLNSITKDASEINSHPGNSSQNAPLLADMKKLSATIPVGKASDLFPVVAKNIAKFDGLLGSAETGIINARKTYLPNDQPYPIQPGQLYLDMNYIDVVFSKNPSPQAALETFFTELKAAGINRIDLSFSQLHDITLIQTGKGLTPNDTVGSWIVANQVQFKQLCATAQEKGVIIDISFGGANATTTPTTNPKTGVVTPPDWQLPAGDPKVSAQTLAQLMKQNNIGSVDIDIEGVITAADTAERYVEFFTELHALLKPQGKKVYLTTLASVTDWPDNHIKFLFSDAEGNFIFPQMFDGINIMAYSSTEYYLDPSNPSWGFEEWLKLFGNENAHMINVGFEDNVDYSKGATPITANSNGEAAAIRYTQLLDALKAKGYPEHLGEVFVWPDYGLNPPDWAKGTLPSTTFEADFNAAYVHWNNLISSSFTVESYPSLAWRKLTEVYNSFWSRGQSPVGA